MEPDLKKAYNDYESSANTAIEYQDAASQLPDKLREAINKKLDYNKDLIAKKNESAAKYFQAPSEARAKYSDPNSPNYIFNPFQAENLVSQYRSGAQSNYQTDSEVLAQRLGSITDIINSASNAFGGAATVAQNKAQLARQKWSDLFDVMKSKSSGGDGGGIGFLNTPSTTQAQLPTEPEPVQPPPSDPQYNNVHWRSPLGQWEWNVQYQSWVPSGSNVVE